MGASFGKSKSKQSSESSSSQDVWNQQAPFLQGLYESGKAMLDQQIGSVGNFTNQVQTEAMAAWQKMLGGGQGMNDALQNYIRQAQGLASEGFSENVLPALTASAIGGNNLGGSRGAIAAGIAGRDAARGQERIATDLTSQAYGQDQNRILQALSMSGGLASLSGNSWAPLLAYSNLLGKPTVLGESSSSSEGSASGFNIGIGMGRT